MGLSTPPTPHESSHHIPTTPPPKAKLDDFSMHQIPTSNLLRELRDLCGIEVIVMACQVSGPTDRVSPGLSTPVQRAVEKAAGILAGKYLS